jgi:hypothetical protein
LQQTNTTSVNQETVSSRSQGSFGTAANYRCVVLDSAKIFVRGGPPPAEIKPRINAVIQREVSEERKRSLSLIAENLCSDFSVILGANREDDCIEPIYCALVSMDSGAKFSFPRKAGFVFPSCISPCIIMLTLS